MFRSLRVVLSAAALAAMSALFGLAAPAMAQPVEYVRVCDLYGVGFYYIPGTEQCADVRASSYRRQTEFGTFANGWGAGVTLMGVDAYGSGVNNTTFGAGAWAGGDPTTDVPAYDPTSGATLEQWLQRHPRSAFHNTGATAIGQGARAGAGADGQHNATAVGQAASANALNATAVGQGATASAEGATAFGQGAQATAAGAVAIGTGSVADTAGTVSFGAAGAERRLVNVAAGVMGTDAVNVAQLNAAVDGLQNAFDTAMLGLQGDLNDLAALVASGGGSVAQGGPPGSAPQATGQGAYASGYGSVADGANTTAIGNGAQALFEGGTAIGANALAGADPTTAVGFSAQATGNNASAFGGFAVASGESATAIGESAVASGDGATALGRGAVASAANSVALGVDSVAARGAQTNYAALGLTTPQTSAGEVSVGAAGAARQITNVAAGSAPTDAVNVAQLEGVLNQSIAYTDARMAAFGADLDAVAREADAGTAAAMALAGLPQANGVGASMVAGAIGVWRDEAALAFGLSHRFDRQWTIKAGGTFTESGDSGFNAGIGFEF